MYGDTEPWAMQPTSYCQHFITHKNCLSNNMLVHLQWKQTYRFMFVHSCLLFQIHGNLRVLYSSAVRRSPKTAGTDKDTNAPRCYFNRDGCKFVIKGVWHRRPLNQPFFPHNVALNFKWMWCYVTNQGHRPQKDCDAKQQMCRFFGGGITFFFSQFAQFYSCIKWSPTPF